MSLDESDERFVIALGLMLLSSAIAWLVLLREPAPIAADGGSHVSPPTGTQLASPPPSARFTGVIVAGHEARLAAEFSGQVVRSFARPGARVRRGQPLLQLAAAALSGTEGLARAQADADRSSELSARLAFEAASDKADRMQRAADAYSERELRAALVDAQRAAAELDRVRAGAAVQRASMRREVLRAKLQTLRAPFDGVVAECFANNGDSVTAASPLLRVVDDARFVRFAVPSAALVHLHVGSTLRVVERASGANSRASLVELQPELDAAVALGFGRAELTSLPAQAPALAPGTRVDVLVSPEAVP